MKISWGTWSKNNSTTEPNPAAFPILFALFLIVFSGGALTLASCSVTAVRPAQEMSNMEVALKAAKEVNADVLAPELFRVATETSQRARREYQFKNFLNAKNLSNQARVYAEKAEFESIRNGGKRDALPEDPLAEPSYPAETIGTPVPGDPAASPASTTTNPTGGLPSINITPKQ